MNDNLGWIKLHRRLMNDELWRNCNANQKVVMITLLLMANHEENSWIFKGERYQVKPGEFVTSLKSISNNADVSIDVVRKSITKFEKYGFLTNVSTKQNRLIKIVNWAKYQSEDFEETKGKTNQRPIKDQSKTNQRPIKDQSKTNQRPIKDQSKTNQRPTNKNDKNDKNDNKMMIDNFCNKYFQLTNKQISSSSKNKLNLIDEKILDQILSEIEKSTYLKNNADISWIINNLNKIVEGKYRDYTKTETVRKTNSFHNFKQLSDNYDENYFEELARKKREEFRRQLEMEEQGVNG